MAQQEVFTFTTVWLCPPNVTTVQIECYAGGGGGGANYTQNGMIPGSGGGAGGGAYSKKNSFAVTPGNSYTVTVGRGGTAGYVENVVGFPVHNGTDGEDSWFNSVGTVLAKGGKGGTSTQGLVSGTKGLGGLAASGVGDTKRNGGDGSDGNFSSWSGAGGGGAGSAADGSAASGSTAGAGGSPDGGSGGLSVATVGTPGGAGNFIGGGGGAGMGGGVSTTAGAGGNGAAGKVILTYTATSEQPTGSESSSVSDAAKIRIPNTLAAPIITFRNPTTPWGLLSSVVYRQSSPVGNALPVLNNSDSDKQKFRIYNNFGLASNIADALNVNITSYDGVGVHTASMPVASQKWIHVWEYGFGQSGTTPGLYTVAKDVDTTIGGSTVKYTIPYGSDGLSPAAIRAGADSHGCGFVEIETYIRVPAAQSGGSQTFAISVSFDWVS